MAVKSLTRGRPRDPARDEAILGAAVELLQEVGYDRMTVDAIAQRAGVGKPTIYRRWPDGKARLVVEALRRLRPARVVPDTGALREDLFEMVRSAIAAMASRSAVVAGLGCHLRDDAELSTLLRETLIADERSLWRAVAERAHERGLTPCPPATELFADLAPSLLHGRLVMTGEPVDDAFAADLVDNVLLPVLLYPHHG